MLRIHTGLQSMLDTGPFAGKAATAYTVVISGLSLFGTGLTIARTVQGLEFPVSPAAHFLEAGMVAGLTADLVLQAIHAVVCRDEQHSRGRALREYVLSLFGLFDAMAVLPYLIGLILPVPVDWMTFFGTLRFLKLARYSPALEMLGAVLSREARPLQSATFMMAMLMIGSSTALYMAERGINSRFSSIPDAMWWSVATLTTLGYGDVVPISPLGKLLGGITALLGIGMFALPASILATGFAEEVKRRDFLTTWNMVAKVPFFSGLDAQQIAAITALLKFYKAASGEVMIRNGDIGDEMYFIVSGLALVHLPNGTTVHLSDGEFFGEISLLHHTTRTATVTARSSLQLLILDVKDFRRFLAGSPQIAELIAQTAERRMMEQAVTDPVG